MTRSETTTKMPLILWMILLWSPINAWLPSKILSSSPGCPVSPSCRVTSISLAASGSSQGEDDDDLLSDVDARVLQSMLQDQKLNLQEEQNMKRLLERGVKAKDTVDDVERKRQKDQAAEESDYSSQVLQTLGSTKLWKGLSRNAADWFESAKIWVENKVERDAKLVASLGIFAFERALKDVSRALPASSGAAKKTQLLLTSESSRQETSDIRDQMTTPADELLKVTQEIKYIFSTGGERRGSGGGMASDTRALKSAAASKTGNNRFLKAYQRQKETTLKREKENIMQTSTRLAGSVMDSAYQVKRELEIEPNQPGYKTKALRESAAQTSRLLASGAKGLLNAGAKAVSQAALPDQRTAPGSASGQNVLPPEVGQQGEVPNNYFMDDSIVDANVRGGPGISDAPINARIPGTSSSDISSLYGAPSQPFQDQASTTDVPTEEEERFFFASQNAPNFEDPTATAPPQSPPFEASEAFYATESSQTFDPSNQGGATFDPAFFADPQSNFDDSNTRKVTAEVVDTTRVPTDQESTTNPFGNGPVQTADVYDFMGTEYDEEEIVLPDEDPQDTLRRVRAEIVSDEDFEIAFGQAKEVDNTAGNEVADWDNEEKEPGIFAALGLRVLDVIFLILEKVLLAVPGLLSLFPLAASRLLQVQGGGLGSPGWETLSRAQRGDKRY